MNGLDRYGVVGANAPSYDGNGNVRSDGASSYGYDANNWLTSVSGALNATRRYDPLGRLAAAVGNATRSFLYDGDQLIAEYDGSGAVLRRSMHGRDGDDPLVWYEGSGLGVRRFLHADHQGSIVAISTTAGVLAINTYDEYGIPGLTNRGRFRYTGQACRTTMPSHLILEN